MHETTMDKSSKKNKLYSQNGSIRQRETITIFMLYKHKCTQHLLQKQNKRGKYFFLGKVRFLCISIVLVGHTLQQGNVVSFQHDPPCETKIEEQRENQVDVDQKKR